MLLPGCGSSTKRTIPTADGDRLIRAIQAADQYSSAGQCGRARRKVVDARFLLGRLPASVDKDTRQGITDGLARLDSLITSECQKPQDTNTQTTQTETTQSQTTPTVTTQTETTQSQTTPTQTQTQTTQTNTVPTSTTPTSTTPTTTTGTGGTPPPPGNGAGNGNSG